MDTGDMTVVYRGKILLFTIEAHPLPCSYMARKRKTRHHRKPRSAGGSDDRENISWVTEKEHAAYNPLFRDVPPNKVAAILNKRWIDPEWVLIARKKRGYRKKRATFQR